MRMRLPLVLAAVAALLGAPSLASAAGNSLVAPTVSPTSGTVTTVFTLRVTYDGKFPATAVNASVAGLALQMAPIGGTPVHGTWSVSTLLPAGSWTPAFTALAERGNTVTVSGPPISVSGPTSAPTPQPAGSGPSPRYSGIDTDGGAPGSGDPVDPGVAPTEGGTDGQPSAAADPVASTAAGPASGGDGDDGTALPAGPSTPPSSPGSNGGGGGGDAPAAAPADAPRAGESDAPGAMPGAVAVAGGAADDEPATAFVEDGLLSAVLLIGLSGVAAVAVIGTALLILGRRRTTDDEAPITVPRRPDTEALLERRTLRQAKMRLSDDPIVAAMGVDDQVAARRQRRSAGQVASGPGERPTPRRR